MDKNLIKTIITFVGGGVIGAGITYVMTKNKYENIMEEEIKSIREYANRKKEAEVTVDNDDKYDLVVDSHKIDNGNVVSTVWSDYNAVTSIYKSKTDEDEDNSPHIISMEDFTEEMNHFDKETIFYYTLDGVLSDNNEEVIEDITNTIGDEAINNFGYRSEDPDIVYVRNPKISIDYEIIRHKKSYSEEVLGIKPTDEQLKEWAKNRDE